MKFYKICFFISLISALSILNTAPTSFAASCGGGGSPAQPPGEPPYGMNVQGDAAGAKLSGVIEISFTNVHCSPAYEAEYGSCEITGLNAAMARVAMRLGRTNLKEANGSQAFYVDIGPVPFQDPQRVQSIATEALRPHILEKFFGVVPPGTNSPLKIYLKEFNNFSTSIIYGADAANPYTEFMTIADITIAVN